MRHLLKKWTDALLDGLGVESAAHDSWDVWVACGLVLLIVTLVDYLLQWTVVPGVRKVYFRVRSFFQYCDYSSITTKNVVALSVVPFPSVRMPGRLYVIGDVNGWDINNGEFFVQENADEIGSGKYYGDIEMTAAQAASGFRFYAELGKWGDNGALPSVGSNPNDGDNATVVLEDGKYTGPCVKGKGNWNITNWPGGKKFGCKVFSSIPECGIIF